MPALQDHSIYVMYHQTEGDPAFFLFEGVTDEIKESMLKAHNTIINHTEDDELLFLANRILSTITPEQAVEEFPPFEGITVTPLEDQGPLLLTKGPLVIVGFYY